MNTINILVLILLGFIILNHTVNTIKEGFTMSLSDLNAGINNLQHTAHKVANKVNKRADNLNNKLTTGHKLSDIQDTPEQKPSLDVITEEEETTSILKKLVTSLKDMSDQYKQLEATSTSNKKASSINKIIKNSKVADNISNASSHKCVKKTTPQTGSILQDAYPKSILQHMSNQKKTMSDDELYTLYKKTNDNTTDKKWVYKYYNIVKHNFKPINEANASMLLIEMAAGKIQQNQQQ